MSLLPFKYNRVRREKVPYVRYFGRLVPNASGASGGGGPVGKSLFNVYSRSEVVNGENLIVCWSPAPTSHLFTLFSSNIYFIDYILKINKDDWNFFEVILGEQPQKPHFDIDISDEDKILELAPNPNRYVSLEHDIKDIILQEVIDGLIDGIREYIMGLNFSRDVLIYTSHGEHKRSAHLVINNYFHRNNKEAKEFYRAVVRSVPELYRPLVDPKVYSSAQQFRMFNSSKAGSGRPKIILTEYTYRNQQYKHEFFGSGNLFVLALQESLISYTCYCKLLPGTDTILVPRLEQRFIASNTYNDIGDLNDTEVELALKLLNDYGPDTEGAFTYRDRHGTMIGLTKTKSYKCIICKRVHDSDNPYLTLMPTLDLHDNKTWTNLDVYYRCHRDTTGQKIHLGGINLKLLAELIDPTTLQPRFTESTNEDDDDYEDSDDDTDDDGGDVQNPNQVQIQTDDGDYEDDDEDDEDLEQNDMNDEKPSLTPPPEPEIDPSTIRNTILRNYSTYNHATEIREKEQMKYDIATSLFNKVPSSNYSSTPPSQYKYPFEQSSDQNNYSSPQLTNSSSQSSQSSYPSFQAVDQPSQSFSHSLNLLSQPPPQSSYSSLQPSYPSFKNIDQSFQTDYSSLQSTNLSSQNTYSPIQSVNQPSSDGYSSFQSTNLSSQTSYPSIQSVDQLSQNGYPSIQSSEFPSQSQFSVSQPAFQPVGPSYQTSMGAYQSEIPSQTSYQLLQSMNFQTQSSYLSSSVSNYSSPAPSPSPGIYVSPTNIVEQPVVAEFKLMIPEIGVEKGKENVRTEDTVQYLFMMSGEDATVSPTYIAKLEDSRILGMKKSLLLIHGESDNKKPPVEPGKIAFPWES